MAAVSHDEDLVIALDVHLYIIICSRPWCSLMKHYELDGARRNCSF